MMPTLYQFTSQELAGLRRRQNEVLAYLSVIAEIHGMPAEVQLTPDGSGFTLPIQSSTEFPNHEQATVS